MKALFLRLSYRRKIHKKSLKESEKKIFQDLFINLCYTKNDEICL